jgi:hypothetical protein
MLKINLVPIDELENPYWYVPDLAVFLIIALVSYFGVDTYLSSIQQEIDETQEKIASLNASTAQLAPDLERFKTLDNDVKTLQTKLQALQKITVSKLERFTPLIVLEHIQNLKPQGVWYTSFTTTNKVNFNLKGMAFNNIMTAELMTSLRATAATEIDSTDLRTQVYFDDLDLVSAILTTSQTDADGQPTIGPPPSSFEIKGTIKERSVPSSQSQPSKVSLKNSQNTTSPRNKAF